MSGIGGLLVIRRRRNAPTTPATAQNGR